MVSYHFWAFRFLFFFSLLCSILFVSVVFIVSPFSEFIRLLFCLDEKNWLSLQSLFFVRFFFYKCIWQNMYTHLGWSTEEGFLVLGGRVSRILGENIPTQGGVLGLAEEGRDTRGKDSKGMFNWKRNLRKETNLKEVNGMTSQEVL